MLPINLDPATFAERAKSPGSSLNKTMQNSFMIDGFYSPTNDAKFYKMLGSPMTRSTQAKIDFRMQEDIKELR